MQVSIHPEKLG